MLNKIALFFRKFPFLHKILSVIYNKFVIKIASGYYWDCTKYFIAVKFPEKKRLKKYGFKKIKPVNMNGWRWGRGLDRAYRRYYTAIYNGEKCFVKVAKNDATIVNEIKINSFLKENLKNTNFTTKLVLCDENFDAHTAMMALNFVKELRNFSISEKIEDFDTICKSFIDILDIFQKNGVIHADIHKGNLMLNNNNLVMLDFGISKVKNIENGIDYKARPGTFYRTESNMRIYNDAYSFIKMLDKMNISEEYKNLESYKNIEKRCEENSMKIEII